MFVNVNPIMAAIVEAADTLNLSLIHILQIRDNCNTYYESLREIENCSLPKGVWHISALLCVISGQF